MNTLYRIYLEDCDVYRDATMMAVGGQFDGFTVTKATGYWKGEREDSIVIEILGTPEDAATVRALAVTLRELNRQEAVLWTRAAVEGELV